MNWWQLSINEVVKKLDTNIIDGLTEQEVDIRLKNFGLNQLPEAEKTSWINILLKQFANFMIIFLLGAFFITIFLQHWLDAIPILIIVLINVFIGFFQEYKAELTLEMLKELITPNCHAIRDGEIKKILVSNLVPGDLVIIKAGDKIPADGRVIEANGLMIDEASLTGEAETVSKITEIINADDLALGDRLNMVFMGTVVTQGDGKIIITETGTGAELGKVTKVLKITKTEKTDIEKRIDKAIYLIVLIFFLVIVLILITQYIAGKSVLSLLLIGSTLAVASIPEGLPAIITISLAIGIRKMAAQNAVIRRLRKIETLGAVSVICTDKTGTLTQKKMEAQKIWVYSNLIDLNNFDFKNFDSKNPNQAINHIMKIAVLSNKAVFSMKDDKKICIGDQTDCALLQIADTFGIDKNILENEYKIIHDYPFDPIRKLMSSLRNTPDNKKILFVKGASDVILKLSKFILNENNEIKPLTEKIIKEIEFQQNNFAQNSLRVLGFAFKEINQENIKEDNLIFVGLIGLTNPLRPEAKKAIEVCNKTGIKVVMITGDHKETAISIAKELNILEAKSKVVVGIELDKMSDAELEQDINNIAVFARMSPYHKMRIINAWKKTDNIIAMTGDGINDAPALKLADIGIAMGITGTDIAKESSDMVLLDDNFASIVNAIKEGRATIDNVKKSILYLFSSNIAEISVIGITTLFGVGYIPFIPIQILWLNLITDGFPATALALDPASIDIMKKSPDYYKKSFLTTTFIINIIQISILITIGALLAFYYGLKTNIKIAQTLCLTSLVAFSFLRIIFIRKQSLNTKEINWWLLLSLVISILLHILIIYVPFLQKIFKTVPLNFHHWIFLIHIALILWLIEYLTKKLSKSV